MITNIHNKSIIKILDRKKLSNHWDQYFEYESDIALCELTKQELLNVIEEKKITKPYIDSKIVISEILNKLGTKHTFHRQFNERHPNLHKEQVLGMQLYALMVEDSEIWTYHETHHAGHLYSNATYFIRES